MKNERDALITIGGASGVGKTTLSQAIEKREIAVYKKIHGVALGIANRIAEERKMDVRTAFELLDDSRVIEETIAITRRHHRVVSDLHFAIQPQVDTVRLFGGKSDDELLTEEEYVSAFPAAELNRIVSQNIILVPLLITCDIDSLIKRIEKEVESGTRVPRSLKKEIVQRECMAELEMYLFLMKQLGLAPRIFVNPDNQFNKLLDEVIAFLELETKK